MYFFVFVSIEKYKCASCIFNRKSISDIKKDATRKFLTAPLLMMVRIVDSILRNVNTFLQKKMKKIFHKGLTGKKKPYKMAFRIELHNCIHEFETKESTKGKVSSLDSFFIGNFNR